MKWALLITAIFIIPLAFAEDQICSGVFVHGDDELNLSDTERRMVCGDEKLSAYQVIPPYQAAFFMTGFLQSRGYLEPDFKTIDGVLHVHVGEKSKLKKISVTSEIPKERKHIKDEVSRLYEGKTLRPKLIDAIEGEALSLLRRRGYPCAEIESSASAAEDSVHLDLKRTYFHRFGEIEREEIEGLHENALARYYPFDADDAFNERLLRLTEKRMTRAEVVQGTYFLEECSPSGEEFSLSQRFLVGPPRTLRFGVGASTELGPMFRVKWSHNRLGSMASILSAKLQGSLRSQSLTLTADTFFWKHQPRRSILSQLEIIRESQIDYEQFLIRVGPVTTKWTRDWGNHHWTLFTGPSLERGLYHSKRNSNTRTYNTGVIQGGLVATHHDYEFFDIHPEQGDQFIFSFSGRHPSLGFQIPSLRLEGDYVKLGRIGQWGRGTLVGGARLLAGTTWTEEEVSPGSLPPAVKFYGGGSTDVRGFLLNTLPRNDGAGALSKLALKLELRRTYLFKQGVEGFVFVDSAYFGHESWELNPQLYYSPGFGARWLSPIGLIQAYAARALVQNPADDDGNFFYVGLGGTF